MTATKDELRQAYLAGFECSETRDFVFTGSESESFELWYAAKYGERDKRIADAEWSRRMDDANRAAGVDLL